MSDKSHCAAAIGRALIENGFRVLFTRTPDIVQTPHTDGITIDVSCAVR